MKKHVHVITGNEKEFQKVFNMRKANSEADQEKRGWWGGGERTVYHHHPPPSIFSGINL